MRYLNTLLHLSSLASWLGAGAAESASPDGSRKKVLFISNVENGLANVLLATSHATVADHPEVDVYYLSFPRLEKTVRELSDSALALTPSAQPIKFENISGVSYGYNFETTGFNIDDTINHPGIGGMSKFLDNLESFLMPWTGPQYVEIYRDLVEKINRIDPDVIALDTMLPPAVDATRNLGRKHVMMSANQLKDHFAQSQPYGAMLWKYPA
jgi:hypothetical protein